MSVKRNELSSATKNIMNVLWSRKTGFVVPETEDITLRDGARDIDATFLYADLAGSSALVHQNYDGYVASIIKAYVYLASQLIIHNGGHIRSFDGDRVMGIFMGFDKNVRATKAGLQINFMMVFTLERLVKDKLGEDYRLNHGVGVAAGKAMMVRGGVRGHNDLIAIGEAPNIAAKLSDIRGMTQTLHITEEVWDSLGYDLCYPEESPPDSWWTDPTTLRISTGYAVTYRSAWWWLEP